MHRVDVLLDEAAELSRVHVVEVEEVAFMLKVLVDGVQWRVDSNVHQVDKAKLLDDFQVLIGHRVDVDAVLRQLLVSQLPDGETSIVLKFCLSQDVSDRLAMTLEKAKAALSMALLLRQAVAVLSTVLHDFLQGCLDGSFSVPHDRRCVTEQEGLEAILALHDVAEVVRCTDTEVFMHVHEEDRILL